MSIYLSAVFQVMGAFALLGFVICLVVCLLDRSGFLGSNKE